MRLECEKQTHMLLQDGVAVSVTQYLGSKRSWQSHQQDKQKCAFVWWEIPVLFY